MSELKEVVFGPVDLPADPASKEYPLLMAEEKIEIVSWGIAAHTTAVTAADTNYTQWDLTNGSTTIGSLANGPSATGTSIAVGSFSDGSVTAGNAILSAGDMLTLEGSMTGTGLQIAGASVYVKYRPAR